MMLRMKLFVGFLRERKKEISGLEVIHRIRGPLKGKFKVSRLRFSRKRNLI